MVTDGLSKTLAFGEKHCPERGWGFYVTSGEQFHDNSIYNADNVYTVGRYAGPGYSLARSVNDPINGNYGSHHPGVSQFVLLDGSVHAFNTSIDDVVLGYMATRAGNEVFDQSDTL
jgi:hypothetical protein